MVFQDTVHRGEPFSSQLQADIAEGLKLSDASRVIVTAVRSGSVIVDWEVTTDSEQMAVLLLSKAQVLDAWFLANRAAAYGEKARSQNDCCCCLAGGRCANRS